MAGLFLIVEEIYTVFYNGYTSLQPQEYTRLLFFLRPSTLIISFFFLTIHSNMY